MVYPWCIRAVEMNTFLTSVMVDILNPVAKATGLVRVWSGPGTILPARSRREVSFDITGALMLRPSMPWAA